MKTKVYIYNYLSYKREGKISFDFPSSHAYEDMYIVKRDSNEIFFLGKLPAETKNIIWIKIIENCISVYVSQKTFHKTIQITDEEKL